MVGSVPASNPRRLLAVLGCCIAAAWSTDSRSKQSDVGTDPSITIPQVTASEPKRAITLDDMVSLREVREPRQSPDGRQIAFLVKQAFRRCDCYRTALYMTSSNGGTPAMKLAEESYIAGLQWIPGGRSLSYLSSKGGSVQLWRMNLRTHRAERVFVHTANHDRSTAHAAYQSRYLPASGVLDYRWSPDGSRVAFTAEPPIDPSYAAAAAKEGFSYDDTTMTAMDLIVGDWASAHRSKQLWIYDVAEKRERVIWTTPGEWYARITALLWSPSGKKLAYFYSANAADGSDLIGIFDADTSTTSQIGSAGGALFSSASAAWSRDESEIAFLARSRLSSYVLTISRPRDHSTRQLSGAINPSHNPWLVWEADRRRFLFLSDGMGQDRRETGVYTLSEDGGELLRLTGLDEKVDDCDVVLNGKIACVWQTTSVPPRPATVSTTNGGIQSLTDVNPEMTRVDLASAHELHWKNSYGDDTNGFLILPKQQAPEHRVPLVLIGYGFNGEFVAQANTVLTTYPAQALARDGIAVLLFNYPRFDGWEGANFERGSRALGYGPLSSIRTIVRQLDDQGLIDPHRVGMMGHSLAGFWVQFAITQTDLLKVAEMHNGGTASEPGMYWEYGTKQQRNLQEQVMGGPPYGDTLKNYLAFSMTLNANRIHAPVLMEYDALESLPAMEYYAALRHYDVPIDFFVYPNDGHVTEHPEHRFMSLQRNLDWFEFWLLNRENDPSSKEDQYPRWRRLRSLWEENIQLEQRE
jgi:dipeptidyl aminopeptidase/acylaminoacyl peptidase